MWNAGRKKGQHAVAKELKNARYALWKNPGDLTARQEAKLASFAQTNQALYRPTCSKSSSARCSPSKAQRASPCSMPG